MQKVSLYRIAELSGGYQSRKGVVEDPTGSHALLQVRDFDARRRGVDVESMARFFPESSSGSRELREGDVVVLSKGSNPFAWRVEGLPEPALAGSMFFVLRPRKGLLSGYLAWYLNQVPARRHLERMSTTGAHMPVVRRKDLETLEVPLPDMQTQRRVVALVASAERQRDLHRAIADRRRDLAFRSCLEFLTRGSERA